VVTDSTDAIKNDSDSTPYGMEMVISNTVPQNYKFTGNWCQRNSACLLSFESWWRREDSNLRPTDYETVALTT
jgi:hypothetical protein